MNDAIIKSLSQITDVRRLVFSDMSAVLCEMCSEDDKSITVANPVKAMERGILISYSVRSARKVKLAKSSILAMPHVDSLSKEHYVRHVIQKSIEIG
jgi:hypothetical protein